MTERLNQSGQPVPVAYKRCMRVFNAFARLSGGSVKTSGEENLPSNGRPYILAANHASPFDPGIVGSAIHTLQDRQVRFLANKELWERHILIGEDIVDLRQLHHLLGWLLDKCEAIPIARNQPLNKEALGQLNEAVEDDEIIGIFPEGGLFHEPQLNTVHLGAGMLAARYGLEIVPVGVAGSDPKRDKKGVRDFGRFHVHFGEPIAVTKSRQTVRSSKAVTPLLASRMQQAVNTAREERDSVSTIDKLLTF